MTTNGKHELIKSHQINLHGDHLVGRFNNWVALQSTKVLSNMWFFWFCVVLDGIEAYFLVQQPFSAVAWVTFIAQTVIQLLALPLLGASQSLISAAQDARAETDHNTLTAIHDLTANVNKLTVQQMDILAALEKHE